MNRVRTAKMAGDLAEHISTHLHELPDGMWATDDDTDAYVLEHLARLELDELRTMRATATVLLGLTASALACQGAAPAVQHMHSDNPDLPSLDIHTSEA